MKRLSLRDDPMHIKHVIFLAATSLAIVGSAACAGTSPEQRQSAAATMAVELINANPITPVPLRPTEPVATASPSKGSNLSSKALKKYAWLFVENTHAFPVAGVVTSLAFSPDSQTLTVVSDNLDNASVRTWDLVGGTALQSIDSQSSSEPVTAMAVSSDGTLQAIGAQAGSIVVRNLSTGRELNSFSLFDDPANQLVFSPSGQQIAVLTLLTDRLTIWDLASNSEIESVWFDSRVKISFSRDFTRMVSATSDAITIWEVPTLQQMGTLDSQSVFITSQFDFSPDGKLVVAGVRLPDDSNAIQTWDTTTGQMKDRWTNLPGYVESVVFSPDGSLLASALTDGTIRVWEAAGGRQLRVLDIYAAQSGLPGLTALSPTIVAFSPDGSKLASDTNYGDIIVWGLNN
jgi:WD40 repeat protein